MKRPMVLLLGCLVLSSMIAAHARATIVELPVSFSVRNVNRSKVPCQTDGKTYTIRGHLVAPRSALSASRRSVALYLHGGTAGEWMWHFNKPGLKTYDYATELAKLGHASLVIDMVGYDSSDHPVGTDVCVGSEADILHQIIGRLRSGAYRLSGRRGLRFRRVALAAQSFGAIRAETETVSFQDADALIVVGYADVPVFALTRIYKVVLNVARTCPTGGEPVEDNGTGPNGYSYAWPSPQAEAEDTIYNADPAMLEAFKSLINRDPCGSFESVPQAIAVHNLLIGTIGMPVLLIYGDHDLITPTEARLHAARFTGSSDVTLRILEETGHTGMLERTAPEFRSVVSSWLIQRGF